MNIKNDPINSKYGCSYTYDTGIIGTFSNFSKNISDGRILRDPYTMNGSDLLFVGKVPDAKMFSQSGTSLKINTEREFNVISTVLENGTEEVTEEEIDFSLYKEVISFSSSSLSITAIPKDQLVSTNFLPIENYDGIESIKINTTNIDCYLALTFDDSKYYVPSYDINEKIINWNATTLISLSSNMINSGTIDNLDLIGDAEIKNSLNQICEGKPKVKFVFLLSIPGNDVNKEYKFDSFNINYIGEDSATKVTQWFNFIHRGFDHAGNAILVADRVIQQNISWNTLAAANVLFANTEREIGGLYNKAKFKLISTSMNPSDASEEWDNLVKNSSSINIGNSKVLTSRVNSLAKVIVRDKDDETEEEYEVVDKTTARDYLGWLPVVIVDINDTETNCPKAVLPEVHSIQDLEVGKCISCDYIYDGTTIGKFKNLGNAQTALLSDYLNNRSGSFYFICVGYTRVGEKICIADRCIDTTLNMNTILAKLTPTSTGSDVEIDAATYKMRLLSASSSNTILLGDNCEYTSLINNSYDPGKTIDEIWHTSKTNTMTMTKSSSEPAWFITMAEPTSTKTGARYVVPTATGNAYNKGFRPILILNSDIHVSKLDIKPFVGYEQNTNQNKYVCSIEVVDSDYNLLDYKLVCNDTIISPYAGDIVSDRVINVSNEAFTNGNNEISIIINNDDTEITVKKFIVTKEASYRETSKHSFGTFYSGFNEEHGVDSKADKAYPVSKQLKVGVKNNRIFVQLNKFTDQVIIE